MHAPSRAHAPPPPRNARAVRPLLRFQRKVVHVTALIGVGTLVVSVPFARHMALSISAPWIGVAAGVLVLFVATAAWVSAQRTLDLYRSGLVVPGRLTSASPVPMGFLITVDFTATAGRPWRAQAAAHPPEGKALAPGNEVAVLFHPRSARRVGLFGVGVGLLFAAASPLR